MDALHSAKQVENNDLKTDIAVFFNVLGKKEQCYSRQLNPSLREEHQLSG